MDSDVDQYCLRWKYHHSNLQYMFAQLLENGSLCDVTLACEGKTIRVHKIMLSACSAYFDSIFSKYEENDPIVILDGIRFDDVTALVEFMYRGEITVEKSRLNALIETAEELQVKGLAAVSWRTTDQGWTGADADLSNDSNGQFTQYSAVKRKLSESSFNDNYSDDSRSDCHVIGHNFVKQKSLESFAPKINVPSPNCDLTKEKVSCNNILNSTPIKKPKVAEVIPKVPVPKLINSLTNPLPNISPVKPLAPLTKENLVADAQTGTTSLISVKEEALSDSETSESSLPVISGVLSLSGREKSDELNFNNVVKMSDHIQQGGWRPHFWELESTKKVMDAIKNKKIEMKFAAELLGVTYGTLYGRYREVHGYLKQPQREFWHDVRFAEILGKLKRKEITLFTAADLMNISVSVLGNHLAKADKDTCDAFLGPGINLPLLDAPPLKPLIKLVPNMKPLALTIKQSADTSCPVIKSESIEYPTEKLIKKELKEVQSSKNASSDAIKKEPEDPCPERVLSNSADKSNTGNIEETSPTGESLSEDPDEPESLVEDLKISEPSTKEPVTGDNLS